MDISPKPAMEQPANGELNGWGQFGAGANQN